MAAVANKPGALSENPGRRLPGHRYQSHKYCWGTSAAPAWLRSKFTSKEPLLPSDVCLPLEWRYLTAQPSTWLTLEVATWKPLKKCSLNTYQVGNLHQNVGCVFLKKSTGKHRIGKTISDLDKQSVTWKNTLLSAEHKVRDKDC